MATGAAMAIAGAPLRTTACCPRWKQTSLPSTEFALSNPRSTNSFLYLSRPPLRFGALSDWSGLKHLGVSLRYRSREIKGRCRDRAAYASLFGVGAPEALVIGVVALLVFGPKGLAEVARNLGKTLRAFQPTIRELQDVSREFKSTLEREIGLDEVQSSLRSPYNSNSTVKDQTVADPNGVQSTTKPYSSEDLLKITEEQLASPSISQTTNNGGEQLQENVANSEAASATGTSEVAAVSTTIPEATGTQTTTPEIVVTASGAAPEANTQIPQEK